MFSGGLYAQDRGAGALPDDMSLGDPQAKVTVIEYASVGCPVCGRWQKEVYPAFKTKYIDTGKVHYVFREMLVGGGVEVAVAASGFLLARCAGKDKYFAVIDAMFANQERPSPRPRETLVDHRQVDGHDRGPVQQVRQRREGHPGAERPRREATPRRASTPRPTFVVNGKQIEAGYHPLEEIDAAIKAAGASK